MPGNPSLGLNERGCISKEHQVTCPFSTCPPPSSTDALCLITSLFTDPHLYSVAPPVRNINLRSQSTVAQLRLELPSGLWGSVTRSPSGWRSSSSSCRRLQTWKSPVGQPIHAHTFGRWASPMALPAHSSMTASSCYSWDLASEYFLLTALCLSLSAFFTYSHSLCISALTVWSTVKSAQAGERASVFLICRSQSTIFSSL